MSESGGDERLKTIHVAVFLVFLLIPSVVGWTGCVLNVNAQPGGSSIVDDAERALGEAYTAVLEAEEAGADVSNLLVELNKAGEYLAAAQVCLNIENSGCAVGNATLCIEQLDGVVEGAHSLQEEARRESVRGLWITVSGSGIAVIGVVLGGWWGWKWFKRWYRQHELQMKPEATEDES